MWIHCPRVIKWRPLARARRQPIASRVTGKGIVLTDAQKKGGNVNLNDQPVIYWPDDGLNGAALGANYSAERVILSAYGYPRLTANSAENKHSWVLKSEVCQQAVGWRERVRRLSLLSLWY